MRAHKNYDTLLQMGGRPSAPIQQDPEHLSVAPEDEGHRIEWHWIGESSRTYQELERWREFREYEQRNRRDPEKFRKYIDYIYHLRQRRSIQSSISLKSEFEHQTKADQWEEYFTYELGKLDRVERQLTHLQREKERVQSSNWQEELRKATEKERIHLSFTWHVRKQVLDLEANWIHMRTNPLRKKKLQHELYRRILNVFEWLEKERDDERHEDKRQESGFQSQQHVKKCRQLAQNYVLERVTNGREDDYDNARWTWTDYELRRWQAFREYQESKRSCPEEFETYTARLFEGHCGYHDLVRCASTTMRLVLKLDPKQQTKLDEWTEYYFFEIDEWLRIRDKYTVQTPANVDDSMRSTEERKGKIESTLRWVESQHSEIKAEMAEVVTESSETLRHYHRRNLGTPTRSSTRIASKVVASSSPLHSSSLKGARQGSTCALSPVHTSRISKPASKKKATHREQNSIGCHRAATNPTNHSVGRGLMSRSVFQSTGDAQENNHNSDRSGKVYRLTHSESSKVSRQQTYMSLTSQLLPSNPSRSLRRSPRIRARLEEFRVGDQGALLRKQT